MEPTDKLRIELELSIEELEAKIAPDGGETVLPLCPGRPDLFNNQNIQ